MRLKAFVAAFLLVMFVGAARAQSAAAADATPEAKGPLFHFTEHPGPLAVGLKVVEQYDFSRTYRSKVDAMGKPTEGERARLLQTLIWYPAEKSGGTPMSREKLKALEGGGGK